MFMDVCITAPFGTVCPRTVVTHTSVFHESDRVFVTKWPTDQKSGLFVIVDSATNKNSFQQSNNIARRFVSSLCFMWRDLFRNTITQVHITLYKEVLSESIRHVSLLFNGMIKDDFNTAPFFVLEHDL